MNEFKIGDRVKVQFEGVVNETNLLTGRVRIDFGDDGYRAFVRREHCTLIEPVYELGAVYVAADGQLFYRLGRMNNGVSWRTVETGFVAPHSYPRRPLVKLVPEVTA